MKGFFRLPIFLLLFCLPALSWGSGEPAGTRQIAKEYRQDNCTLRLLVESDTVSSADDLRVRIEAEAPEDWRIESLDFDPGRLRVLEQNRSVHYTAESGRFTTRVDYRLEPYLPGDYPIPGAKVAFVNEAPGTDPAETGKVELRSEELSVRVVSAAAGGLSVPGILGDPEDLPEEESLRTALFTVAALLVAAVGAFFLFRLRKKRKLHQDAPSAKEVTEREIHSLIEAGLLDRKEYPLFFSMLSAAILSYAGHNGQARVGGNGPEEAALEEFLHLSELVRFARHTPSEGEIRYALDCCAAILKEETKEPGDASAPPSIPSCRPGV